MTATTPLRLIDVLGLGHRGAALLDRRVCAGVEREEPARGLGAPLRP